MSLQAPPLVCSPQSHVACRPHQIRLPSLSMPSGASLRSTRRCDASIDCPPPTGLGRLRGRPDGFPRRDSDMDCSRCLPTKSAAVSPPEDLTLSTRREAAPGRDLDKVCTRRGNADPSESSCTALSQSPPP